MRKGTETSGWFAFLWISSHGSSELERESLLRTMDTTVDLDVGVVVLDGVVGVVGLNRALVVNSPFGIFARVLGLDLLVADVESRALVLDGEGQLAVALFGGGGLVDAVEIVSFKPLGSISTERTVAVVGPEARNVGLLALAVDQGTVPPATLVAVLNYGGYNFVPFALVEVDAVQRARHTGTPISTATAASGVANR